MWKEALVRDERSHGSVLDSLWEVYVGKDIGVSVKLEKGGVCREKDGLEEGK